MEIKRIGTYATQVAQRTSEQNARAVGDEKSVSGKEATAESDRVRLSRGYQEMAQVKKVMMDRADIRTDRVDHFRNMITNNAYVVEPDKVAERMLQDVW